MELGEKLLRARLEAGLSQRQLCGEEITRNMLSQIEHGTASPSLATLRYLAGRLGKSVSYFLEEDAVVSPNQALMDSARRAVEAEDYAAAARALEDYRAPDPVFDRERDLLQALARLGMAEAALAQDRRPYARSLLEAPMAPGIYCFADLERRRRLLLWQLGETPELPALDEELLLRARGALAAGEGRRALALLEAAEDHLSPRWCLLHGQACMSQGQYAPAAESLHRAEAAFPEETAPLLERCYRELEDFRRAYEYACRCRTSGKM